MDYDNIDNLLNDEGIDLTPYWWITRGPLGVYELDGLLSSAVLETEHEEYEHAF